MILIHQRHRRSDRQTDRQTTCSLNTALCTKVHHGVKINHPVWKNWPLKPCPHWRLCRRIRRRQVAKFGGDKSPFSATVAEFGDCCRIRWQIVAVSGEFEIGDYSRRVDRALYIVWLKEARITIIVLPCWTVCYAFVSQLWKNGVDAHTELRECFMSDRSHVLTPRDILPEAYCKCHPVPFVTSLDASR